MSLKILIPASAFVFLSAGSYYLASSPLGYTDVDRNFYDSGLNLTTNEGITSDPINVRNYLLFNSFHFI